MRGELKFKRFIIHRFCRVLPSYWLSTVLIVIFGMLSINIIGSTITSAGGSITELKYLPLNVLCLNFANPVNGVAWFLAVNLICYIWYYLMYLMAKKNCETKDSSSNETQGSTESQFVTSLSGVLFVISILSASICVYIMKGNPLQNIARGIASFGVGGGIAVVNNWLVHSRRKQQTIVAVSLLTLVICIFGLAKVRIFQENTWLVEVYFLFPSIVFLITNLADLREMLSKPWMRVFGAYSYTIYIFQTAVMTILYFLFGLAGNYNWYSKGNFLVNIASIIGFGIAMYYIWDKPIGDRIKKMEERIS